MTKKIFIIAFVFTIALFSCKSKRNIDLPGNDIVGLATPVVLNIQQTAVNLQDYFTDVNIIDSVKVDAALTAQLNTKKDSVNIKVVSDKLAKISLMYVYTKNGKYSILVKKNRKIKIDYKFTPINNDIKTVQLAGSFNNWSPNNTNLTKNGNDWTTSLELEPGAYQYQIVIDGKWQLDPNCSEKVDNGNGGLNSLLKAGNADDTKYPKLYTISKTDESITIGCQNGCSSLIALYQNSELPENFIQKDSTKYTITIPSNATNVTRSYIRIWASNDLSISNDLYIPLNNSKVLDDNAQLVRTDFEAATIYNVFIDRFFDGDTTNDRPIKSPDVNPKVDYFGGDVAGITKKIDAGYFDGLGTNTLWISPVIKNPATAWGNNPDPVTKFSGYHGYWPVSFNQPDPHITTPAQLKEFTADAHKNNMNVLLDFVAHHVHTDHPFYIKNPTLVTNNLHEDGVRCIGGTKGDKYNSHWDGECRLKTWFDTFLPTLDLKNPIVYNMLSDSAVYWIKEYDLDGFRHDAAKHVPEVFWRALTKKLKEQVIIPQQKKIYQIGETYGSPELINSYVSSGQFDGQFDFNVYDAAVGAFVKSESNFDNLIATLKTSFKFYGNHHLMGNITGNQDRTRFITYASGAAEFSEDQKLIGWKRDIEVKDPIGYNRLAQLTALIATIPGIPVIYYGDEIGMPGANDPDNRRQMKFENLTDKEKAQKLITSKLMHIRHADLALIYGDFEVLYKSDKQLVFARTYFDKISIVVFNKDNAKATVEFEVPERFNIASITNNFDGKFTTDKNKIKIELEPNSFDLLTSASYKELLNKIVK